MSNSVEKQERQRAPVWIIRKDSGRLSTRLTTPSYVGAFLMRGTLPRGKAISIMVAPAVPALNRIITINFSRSFLRRAAEAYERGDYIAAGVLFREALRRQLWAECEWHGILPQGASAVTSPKELLKAAYKAGLCTADIRTLVREMISIGNATAHCRKFEPRELHASILLLFDIIDVSPYQQPVNGKGKLKPEPLIENADYEVDDCDDDDRRKADWWKPEDWTPQL